MQKAALIPPCYPPGLALGVLRTRRSGCCNAGYKKMLLENSRDEFLSRTSAHRMGDSRCVPHLFTYPGPLRRGDSAIQHFLYGTSASRNLFLEIRAKNFHGSRVALSTSSCGLPAPWDRIHLHLGGCEPQPTCLSWDLNLGGLIMGGYSHSIGNKKWVVTRGIRTENYQGAVGVMYGRWNTRFQPPRVITPWCALQW